MLSKNKTCFCCNNPIPKDYKGMKYCWDCHLEIDKEIAYLYRLARRQAIINVKTREEGEKGNEIS